MAKGKKTGGRNIQKGQRLPGAGKKPLPDDLKHARNMAYEQMIRETIAIRNMTPSQLAECEKKGLAGIAAIAKAYQRRDYQGIKYFEDRVFGKAKETHILEMTEGNQIKIVFEDATEDKNDPEISPTKTASD